MSARFSIPITVRADDIDELGHVSNLVYLRWVLDVAMAHSRAVGWDHPQYRERGAVFVVRRHEIDYVAPVNLGDAIIATTWVESWRGASCIRRTDLARGEQPTQIVARAASTWAFMAFATGRPQRIPEDLVAIFTAAAPAAPRA